MSMDSSRQNHIHCICINSQISKLTHKNLLQFFESSEHFIYVVISIAYAMVVLAEELKCFYNLNVMGKRQCAGFSHSNVLRRTHRVSSYVSIVALRSTNLSILVLCSCTTVMYDVYLTLFCYICKKIYL